MNRRSIVWAPAPVLIAVLSVTPRDTAVVVSIIMEGTYFTDPANVRFVVAVEPDEENRFLWVEADSDGLYRASEVTLQGAREKRLHAFLFKSLPGGDYMLRAEVRSQSGVRSMATRRIVVTGGELR